MRPPTSVWMPVLRGGGQRAWNWAPEPRICSTRVIRSSALRVSWCPARSPATCGAKPPGGSRRRMYRIAHFARWRQAAAVLGLGLGSLVAQDQPPNEYLVKAAFLYNFAKFVEWPAEAFPQHS